VNICTSWLTVLHKRRKLVVTSEQVYLLSSKSSEIYQKYFYKDIEGITKSLFQGSQNFIIHYKKQESLEMTSEYKDEIIEVIF
jgi:hypothetical protein